jgi:hypothetical protein
MVESQHLVRIKPVLDRIKPVRPAKASLGPAIAVLYHLFHLYCSFSAITIDPLTYMLTYLLSIYCCSWVGPKRVRYVDPSLGRRKEAQDTRVAATTKKQRLEERNKRALFANVDDLKKLSKQEYCEFRC